MVAVRARSRRQRKARRRRHRRPSDDGRCARFRSPSRRATDPRDPSRRSRTGIVLAASSPIPGKETRMAKKRTAKAARPRKSAHRRSADRSVERRQGRAAAAIEEVRRGPLEPEIPLDPQAPLGPVDPDALEVLHDTQALAADAASDETEVGPTATDKARAIVLAGGDVDAAGDGDVGEETVGGSTPTPDQDVVDDLGRAVGVTYA